MYIHILPSNTALPRDQRERIAERAAQALSRLGGQVRRVELRLADVNGPRGGIDKRCRVLVHLNGGAPVLVEERGDRLRDLIDRALQRAGWVVRKRLGIATARPRSPRHGQAALFG